MNAGIIFSAREGVDVQGNANMMKIGVEEMLKRTYVIRKAISENLSRQFNRLI